MLVAETCRSLNALVRNVPKRLGNLTEEVQGRISSRSFRASFASASMPRSPDARHPGDPDRHHDLGSGRPRFCATRSISAWRRGACAPTSNTIFCSTRFTRPAGEAIRSTARPSIAPRRRGRGLRAHRRRRAGQLDRLPLASWTWRLRRRAFEHLDEAKRLTSLGIGICFLPEAFAAPDVAEGRLWPLLAAAEQPSMPIFVITNPPRPEQACAPCSSPRSGPAAKRIERRTPLAGRNHGRFSRRSISLVNGY